MRVPANTRPGGFSSATLTPMIDVVFQLLIFFLWSSSFQTPERDLPGAVELPAGTAPATTTEPPPEADFDRLVVRVLWPDNPGPATPGPGAPGRARYTVNGAPHATLAELRAALERVARVKRDMPLILHPDGGCPFGPAIEVYDLCRLVGFANVQFAAAR